MRIQIGDINLLSLQDWNEYNLVYWLIGVLIILYSLYYIIISQISDNKNNKPRWAVKIEPNLDYKIVSQDQIEHTRDFLSQLHALARHYYTNEIIGLNIFNVSGKLEYYITSTSNTSLISISEALSKNKNLDVKIGQIFDWNNQEILKNYRACYYSQVKLQKKDYPIKHDSVTFSTGLINTLASVPSSGIAFTLLPYDYQSKFELKIRKLLHQKQNEKGMLYVQEHNKIRAGRLTEKNKFPLFLTKIELFSQSKEQLKIITSQFNSLSTGSNKFYSFGATKYNRQIIQNKIHCQYWFSWLMPKPHFYLNSSELAYLWQPVKAGYIVSEQNYADQTPYDLNAK